MRDRVVAAPARRGDRLHEVPPVPRRRNVVLDAPDESPPRRRGAARPAWLRSQACFTCTTRGLIPNIGGPQPLLVLLTVLVLLVLLLLLVLVVVGGAVVLLLLLLLQHLVVPPEQVGHFGVVVGDVPQPPLEGGSGPGRVRRLEVGP